MSSDKLEDDGARADDDAKHEDASASSSEETSSDETSSEEAASDEASSDEASSEEAASEGDSDARVEAGADGVAEKVATEPQEPSIFALFRDAYLVFDRRTLAVTRFLLGFLVMCDLIHRRKIWEDMYGWRGVLPNHLNLFRPQAWGAFSIFNAFSTSPELWVLWWVFFGVAFCLFIGFKTKWMQVLTMIFVTSMNGRILLIENGGYVVNNLLTLWTMFLPLGDRYSVDALLLSMKRRRESTEAELNDRTGLVPDDKVTQHVSFMGVVIFLQLSAIYFFNVVHKKGPAWHDGTAVHYVLYVDRMATPMVALVRDYIPNFLIKFMTRATLAFEAALPFALLLPIARPWARRAAIFMINTLHIAFGTTFVLGPFAWSACTFSSLLFSKDDWDWANKTMRRTKRARTVLYDPKSGAAFFACRLLKRFDRWELLTFKESPGLASGLAVEVPSVGESSRRTRHAALYDLVSAIPLGPVFAWAIRLPVISSLVDWLFERGEGGAASRTFGLRVPAASFVAPEKSTVRRRFDFGVAGLRELAAAIMFAGAVNQAAVELWVIRDRFKVPQPEPMRLLAQKLRFLQGWFMFSPNPVMDDGTIVVDAVTVDGRHIDPFTMKPPLENMLDAKSLAYDQMWCDYFNRIHLPGNSGYRDAMKDFMLRLPERTGNPNDAIVSGDVYWISDMNPPWGSTKSYRPERTKIFSFEAPKPLPPSVSAR